MLCALEELQDASEELKSNHAFVMAAVRKNPWNLRHASEELKNDHAIVMAAVSQKPMALHHVSEDLKNNHPGNPLRFMFCFGNILARQEKPQKW